MEHAGGEYLQFLNSGDFLVGDVLGQVDFDGTKYIYGDVRVAVSADKKIDIQISFFLSTLSFILLKDTILSSSVFHFITPFSIINDTERTISWLPIGFIL